MQCVLNYACKDCPERQSLILTNKGLLPSDVLLHTISCIMRGFVALCIVGTWRQDIFWVHEKQFDSPARSCKASLTTHCRAKLLDEAVTDGCSAIVKPHYGLVQGLPCFLVPEDGGLSLICDTYCCYLQSQSLLFCSFYCSVYAFLHCVQQFKWVMLRPTTSQSYSLVSVFS